MGIFYQKCFDTAPELLHIQKEVKSNLASVELQMLWDQMDSFTAWDPTDKKICKTSDFKLLTQ